jgi:hypothetical protein
VHLKATDSSAEYPDPRLAARDLLRRYAATFISETPNEATAGGIFLIWSVRITKAAALLK